MLGSLEEKNTTQTRVADLGHRSSRLQLTGLDYACAETDIGEILLRMIEGHTESGHRSSRLHDWTGRWKRWRDRLDIIGTLL